MPECKSDFNRSGSACQMGEGGRYVYVYDVFDVFMMFAYRVLGRFDHMRTSPCAVRFSCPTIPHRNNTDMNDRCISYILCMTQRLFFCPGPHSEVVTVDASTKSPILVLFSHVPHPCCPMLSFSCTTSLSLPFHG